MNFNICQHCKEAANPEERFDFAICNNCINMFNTFPDTELVLKYITEYITKLNTSWYIFKRYPTKIAIASRLDRSRVKVYSLINFRLTNYHE